MMNNNGIDDVDGSGAKTRVRISLVVGVIDLDVLDWPIGFLSKLFFW